MGPLGRSSAIWLRLRTGGRLVGNAAGQRLLKPKLQSSVTDFERRGIFRFHFATIIDVQEWLGHAEIATLGNVGVVVKRVRGRGGAQRVRGGIPTQWVGTGSTVRCSQLLPTSWCPP
jgi:hypothetical protein